MEDMPERNYQVFYTLITNIQKTNLTISKTFFCISFVNLSCKKEKVWLHILESQK